MSSDMKNCFFDAQNGVKGVWMQTVSPDDDRAMYWMGYTLGRLNKNMELGQMAVILLDAFRQAIQESTNKVVPAIVPDLGNVTEPVVDDQAVQNSLINQLRTIRRELEIVEGWIAQLKDDIKISFVPAGTFVWGRDKVLQKARDLLQRKETLRERLLQIEKCILKALGHEERKQ